jgi:hypothetical protein
MEFNDWLQARGIDPQDLSGPVKAQLQAQWRAEENGPQHAAADAAGEPVAFTPRAAAPPPAAGANGGFDATMAAIEEEAGRVEYIRERTVALCQANLGDRSKVEMFKAMCESAVADKTCTRQKFDLEALRADRAAGPHLFVPQGGRQNVTAQMVEAAVCRQAGLPNIENHYDQRTLEASEQQFKRGLSLVGLLHHSAQRNGWRGMPDPNSRDFLRAAFGQQGGAGGEYDLLAGTTGPSTFSLPNILGNVANKYLRAGFMGVDSAWSRIAAKRSVNNFQTVTGVSLNGATIYRTLAPGGEIKHATLSETTYTNRASTYAIMIGINRESLVNDDAGVFSRLSQDIGRGAGLKINDLFWTAFLNNSSFFTSGNGNVSTGAGSALGTADGAAINAAEVKFVNQTGADGYPIAAMPKILLAPPTLANTARRWMGSQGFAISGTAGLGDTNIYAGRYSIETSPYMENSTYTGYSTAAWYLLADPNDIPVIEGVALNGRWEPTVDSAEADFNQLGVSLRGFIDVGFSLYEYRGGVRSAGS